MPQLEDNVDGSRGPLTGQRDRGPKSEPAGIPTHASPAGNLMACLPTDSFKIKSEAILTYEISFEMLFREPSFQSTF